MASSKRLFTIGYGGRSPTEFVRLLVEHGVRTVADVRLVPDKAFMAVYAKAKSSNKGIERILGEVEIGYVSLTRLGNPFKDSVDWPQRYRDLFEQQGDTLISPLLELQQPFCLLCAEKEPERCHRMIISDLLATRGWEIEHIR